MDVGNYNTQSLRASFAASPTSGVPEMWEIRWGQNSGNLPNIRTVPYTGPAWTEALKTLLPGPGVYYAKAKLTNKIGSLESPEYPFECGVAPDGEIRFSIG